MWLLLNKRIRYCFVLFTLFCYVAKAQYFAKRDSWKKERKEWLFGGGAANFLGDLGGLNKIGTHYSYADLELVLTDPSASLGYRYRINKRFASRTEFSYLLVKGDDKLTLEPFRHNRNLNFRSNIFEFSTNIEVSLSFDRHGNKYHIKKTMFRRYKQYSAYYYLFVGVGGFWYNPKANFGGNWYALHDLSTEGQGLPGGPKKYKRISVSIPMGIGVRYKLNAKWTVGFEYNFRKTFTDYIDDVSSTYYDKNILMQYKGPAAVGLADPSLGIIPCATCPNGDGTGAQRGDTKDKDSYMNLQIKVGYVLSNKKRRRITKAKF
jgi:opacity protein-like surface antigen